LRFYRRHLSDGVWPDRLPAVEVRIAGPTDKLGEVLEFFAGTWAWACQSYIAPPATATTLWWSGCQTQFRCRP